MKPAVVIIGLGELGGFLRLSHPAFPVTHVTSSTKTAAVIPAPALALALVPVAGQDLAAVPRQIPPLWRGRIALLQNGFLPADWAVLPATTLISG